MKTISQVMPTARSDSSRINITNLFGWHMYFNHYYNMPSDDEFTISHLLIILDLINVLIAALCRRTCA
jgi:hypothetical protein